MFAALTSEPSQRDHRSGDGSGAPGIRRLLRWQSVESVGHAVHPAVGGLITPAEGGSCLFALHDHTRHGKIISPVTNSYGTALVFTTLPILGTTWYPWASQHGHHRVAPLGCATHEAPVARGGGVRSLNPQAREPRSFHTLPHSTCPTL